MARKWQPLPEECRESEIRAERALSAAFYGIHHVDGWARRVKDHSGLRITLWGPMSTYDYAQLTRLVIACHDECLRLEIEAIGPRRMYLYFHARQRESTSFVERHPTIEQAVEAFRASCRENRLAGEGSR